MKTTFRRLILICFVLLSSMAFAPATHAATQATCTADVRVSGTAFGTVVIKGNFVSYHNFQVAGRYISGVLAGSSLAGIQDIRQSLITGHAMVEGSYRVTAPGGTLRTDYVLSISGSGQVTGYFTAKAGTGTLAHTQWGGRIRGHLVSVSPVGLPTYLSTFSGPCHNLA